MYTNLYAKLLAKEETISLVSPGCVDMPVAKKVDVIGYDPGWSFARRIKAAIEWYKENL